MKSHLLLSVMSRPPFCDTEPPLRAAAGRWGRRHRLGNRIVPHGETELPGFFTPCKGHKQDALRCGMMWVAAVVMGFLLDGAP